VPVIVKEATPQAQLELALVENLQRADLNPLEEAAAYAQLVEEFSLSQEQVAAKVGKNRSTVANALRLLKLGDEARQALLAGLISEGHARALLGLDDAGLQTSALARVVERGLNVRQTEALVRKWNEGAAASREPAAMSPADRETVELFRQALGTQVELSRGKRGGKLVIHFYSDEELASLYDRVRGT
jgi:ParB family chromosome partitioning protein